MIGSAQVHPSIEALFDYYRSLRFWHVGWWLFPKAIATAFEGGGDSTPGAIAKNVFDIFLGAEGFFAFIYHWFLGSYFSDDLLSNVKVLRECNLFTVPNFERVAQHQHPRNLLIGLQGSKSFGLLTGLDAQTNFDFIVEGTDPSMVIAALNSMQANGLLRGEGADANREAVFRSQRQPQQVASVLAVLDKAGLLTGADAAVRRAAVVQHQNLVGLECVLRSLSELNYFSGLDASYNFNAVVRHLDPMRVVAALTELNKNGFLSGADAPIYRKLAIQHPMFAGVIARTLKKLQAEGLLSTENVDMAIQHQNPAMVVHAIKILQSGGLLNSDNLNVVIRHQNPFKVAAAMRGLETADLFSWDNLDVVTRAKNLLGCALALKRLNEAQLLTGDEANTYREVLAQHNNPSELGLALQHLCDKGLWCGENASRTNIHAIAACQDSLTFSLLLSKLADASLFSVENQQAYFDALVRHAYLKPLYSFVCCLRVAELVTQENYAFALDYTEVLFGGALDWKLVDTQFFQENPQRFEQIRALCRAHEHSVTMRQDALQRYVQHELGVGCASHATPSSPSFFSGAGATNFQGVMGHGVSGYRP